MKIVLSALVLALALPQVAQAEATILVTGTKVTKAEKNRPPLDQTATNGIASEPGAATQPGANPLSQPYPPPLDLHF